jgi:lysophospholipase L1-like esterase
MTRSFGLDPRSPTRTGSRSIRGLLVIGVVDVMTLTSCSSPTPPTIVLDPPKITCPVPPTVQLTTSVNSIPVVYDNPMTMNGKPPVTTTCVPASGSSFSLGRTTVSCTATDALQRADVCSFVVTVVPPPVLAATRFLAFGDSITRGEDGRNSVSDTSFSPRFYPRVYLPDAQTYPGVLQQSLADRYRTQSPMVFNKGCPGEAVTDIETFARFVGLTSSRQYEVALIMEGSNDVYLGTKDSRVLATAIVGLRQMVRDAKSRGIRPYLATIPPMNPAGSRGSHYGADLVPGFNDSIRSVAAAEGVTLVDVYQGFGGDLTLLGSDGLHPNAAGYARIAGLFFDKIQQSLEGTPPLSVRATWPPNGTIRTTGAPNVRAR